MLNTARPAYTGPVTPSDIEQMARRDDFGGWGYLGHGDRTHDSDVALADAANHLGIDAEDTFLWANSRPGRHFMDGAADDYTTDDFRRALTADINRWLPALRAEVGR